MESKLTDFLKDGNASDRVAARIEDYDRRYGGTARDGLDERKKDYRNFENTYYDLVTDFFEYGWGQYYHVRCKTQRASQTASHALPSLSDFPITPLINKQLHTVLHRKRGRLSGWQPHSATLQKSSAVPKYPLTPSSAESWPFYKKMAQIVLISDYRTSQSFGKERNRHRRYRIFHRLSSMGLYH